MKGGLVKSTDGDHPTPAPAHPQLTGSGQDRADATRAPLQSASETCPPSPRHVGHARRQISWRPRAQAGLIVAPTAAHRMSSTSNPRFHVRESTGEITPPHPREISSVRVHTLMSALRDSRTRGLITWTVRAPPPPLLLLVLLLLPRLGLVCSSLVLGGENRRFRGQNRSSRSAPTIESCSAVGLWSFRAFFSKILVRKVGVFAWVPSALRWFRADSVRSKASGLCSAGWASH